VNLLACRNSALASDDNNLANLLASTCELHVRVTVSQIESVDEERADV
jgi:hypothetical protein